MAILDVTSKNPDLSWVIFKNPETQQKNNAPFQRSLRKGNVYGWYKDNESFRILFKDSEHESSFYKNLKNNHLDQSPYHCAYVYTSMMAEMLSAPIKQQHEKDTVNFNEIKISTILISSIHMANAFMNYFSEKVKIELTPISKKVYSVIFSGNVTLHYLSNLVQVFCLIQALEDRNIYIDMTEGVLNKYAQALKTINAPYFIVYLFISRCVPDMNAFKIIQPILQQDGWKLHFGNTQKQRYLEIKKHIDKGNVLHDLGCGELYYSRNLNEFYDTIYAWDTDSHIQERNARFIKKKNLTNIVLKEAVTNTSELNFEGKTDILITEMLEHMPKEQAGELVIKLSQLPFRKLIMTVPNKDFNQFYKLETEFRHDDHHWEPTYQETIEWFKQLLPNDERFKIIPIGDAVNNIHVSTLIVLENKNG